jgi:5-methylcytosine-specific restriction endonuclease McrA
MQPICSCCSGTEWLGKPMPLELDHINGDNANNSLDNLRLLCPNCHAQTPTYRGKNQDRAK